MLDPIMQLIDRLKSDHTFQKSSGKPSFPEAGIFHYIRENELGKVRLHLRIDADGNSMLIVNAARFYYFNPSATYLTYLILEQYSVNQAVYAMTNLFKVTPDQAKKDLAAIQAQLKDILSLEGFCPACEMDFDITMPFSHHPSAPYRMDLALTYRCNNDCFHCYNARPRQYPEVDTSTWMLIIDKLWDIGIPHIVFTGGEPTLREDLPQLIAHAERNGQITGINTNGRRLKDPDYLQRLIDAGLDHIQVTLESHDPDIHDAITRKSSAWKETVSGIENALQSKLFVMTNTTLLRKNSVKLKDTLTFLKKLRVQTIGLNALIHAGKGSAIQNELTEMELNGLLSESHVTIHDHGQHLIWYTPTQYCHFNPIEMKLGVKGCTAALYNMCIEPDGSVLPCQSYYQSLGNFLSLPWEAIWDHPLAISLRQRHYLPDECRSCAIQQECGGGCPLARQAGCYAEPIQINPQFVQPAVQVGKEN